MLPSSFQLQSLLGFVFAAMLVAPAAGALDFGGASVVYRELLAGETTYPTTPEIDKIGAGGFIGASIPLGSAPTLTGSAAHVSLPYPGPFSRLLLLIQSNVLGESSFGLRAGFENLTASSPGFSRSEVSAGFDLPTHPIVGVLLAVAHNPGNDSAQLSVLNSSQAGGGAESVPIPPAALAALVAGAAFEIDLFVDRSKQTAVGSVAINGFGTIETPVLALTQVGGNLTGWNQAAGHSSPGPDQLDVDLTSFEVHALVPQVPALRLVGGVILVVALLAGAWRAIGAPSPGPRGPAGPAARGGPPIRTPPAPRPQKS